MEHIDRNSSFVGLLVEQKALYVYLYEKEMKASMSELTEIYKPIANLIKPILPLSSSQIEKRARIRKDFLAFIKVDEKKKAKEEEEVYPGSRNLKKMLLRSSFLKCLMYLSSETCL